MYERSVLPVLVIIRRSALANRRQLLTREAIGVIPNPGSGTAPRLLMKDSAEEQWLHGGIELKRCLACGPYIPCTSKASNYAAPARAFFAAPYLGEE